MPRISPVYGSSKTPKRRCASISRSSSIQTWERSRDTVTLELGFPDGRKDSVMTATFEIDGLEFVALNGGPIFTFNEAVSFQVDCATQDEVDYY